MTTIIQIADWDVVRMGALFALGMIGVSALVVMLSAGLLWGGIKIKGRRGK